MISNSLVRGALTAVLWLVKPQYPLVVVATFDEAQACVHRWATDSGLVVPLARMDQAGPALPPAPFVANYGGPSVTGVD